MSADNYYIVDVHPLGGYGVEMGFESWDEGVFVNEKSQRFDTLPAATDYAMNEYSEYGVTVAPRAYLKEVRDEIAVGLRTLRPLQCGESPSGLESSANFHIDLQEALAVVLGTNETK